MTGVLDEWQASFDNVGGRCMAMRQAARLLSVCCTPQEGRADYPFAGRDKGNRTLRTRVLAFYEALVSESGDAYLWNGRLLPTLVMWLTCMAR